MKIAQLEKDQLIDIITQQSEQIAMLEQRLRALLQRQYGQRTEHVNQEQLNLFDEENRVDSESASATEITSSNTDNDSIKSIPEKDNSRGKRKRPDEKLERHTVHHELREDERLCACGGVMTDIGQDSAESYEYIPARVIVIQHVQHKYACPCCQTDVYIAPKPPQLLPRSNAGPGILSHIATTKFVDGVPLHRQEAQYDRVGLRLPRNTMARWLIKVGERIVPLINLCHDALLSGPYLQCDETPFKVLKEVGRAPTTLSYMWVMRGGERGREVVYYHYAPSRSGAVIADVLNEYRGYVQCDGYSAYGALESQGIVLVGCMAHARRKFVDVIKTTSDKELSQKSKASEAIRFISKLYAIEKETREASDSLRYNTRQTQAIPLLSAFKEWLDAQANVVLPKSPLGQAISYALNQWQKIIRYCDQGFLEIDNNADERAIRPFACGRRNWLFSDTPQGAHTNARFYSLIETCKLHGHEPYAYLKHVFKELPHVTSLAGYEALLPWNLDAATLRANAMTV